MQNNFNNDQNQNENQNQQHQDQYENQNQQQQNYYENPNQQQTPPYNQTININVPPQNYVPRSKIAAGLLGIFLGYFGVHNFYLGYTGKAIAQLLITVLTCGFGSIITGIWGLIEGILILTGSIATDGNGFPLQQ